MVDPNATQDATSGAAEDVSSGAGASGAASDATREQASGAGDSGSQDYLARVRAGGDFAAEQVRSLQSRADRAEARLQKLGKLPEYVEQGIRPEDIEGWAARYKLLERDERLGPALQRWDGQSPLPIGNGSDRSDAGDDDEYLSDEQRELRELKQRYETDTRDLTVNQAKQSLKGHLQNFFAAFDPEDGVRERVLSELEKNIDAWSRSQAGLQSVKNITSPGGEKFVRTALLGMMSDAEIDKARERARLRERDKVRGRATDVPSGGGTTGREVPADVSEQLRGKGAREALAFAREHPELLEQLYE